MPLHHKVVHPQRTVDLGRYATFPPGYRPTNPSIVRHGDCFLVCVRGVNYAIDQRLSMQQDGLRRPSLNRLFFLHDDLTFKAAIEVPHEQLDGVEDLKLFSGLDHVWAVGSSRVDDPRSESACAMTLVKFNTELSCCELVQLASPFGFPLEKNWSPFFADGALHFLYSCTPPLVLQYDPETNSVRLVGCRPSNPDCVLFVDGGSSAGIASSFGTVFLTHRRVVRLPSRRRIYLSRVCSLNHSFTKLAAGPFFSIGRATIQFVNGMVRRHDDILIAYGEMDATAQLACFTRRCFEHAVFPQAGQAV